MDEELRSYLAGMEQRLDQRLIDLEQRTSQKFSDLEQLLVEKMRGMQAELLRGFESFSNSHGIRLRKLEADQVKLRYCGQRPRGRVGSAAIADRVSARLDHPRSAETVTFIASA